MNLKQDLSRWRIDSSIQIEWLFDCPFDFRGLVSEWVVGSTWLNRGENKQDRGGERGMQARAQLAKEKKGHGGFGLVWEMEGVGANRDFL
jgi:hypothetical protein